MEFSLALPLEFIIALRFDEIILEISSNILPVRNGRRYKRTKGQLSGTYSNVNKRSF